ncbi:MAG: high-potential iron-sulfur protein [Granulosicoccus sp.]
MTDIKRRKFVTLFSASAAVVPLSALITSLPSHAADPMVNPESAQAKALQYDIATDDKMCITCALFTGVDGTVGGSCPLFPGSTVHAEAYCSAFVPKS